MAFTFIIYRFQNWSSRWQRDRGFCIHFECGGKPAHCLVLAYKLHVFKPIDRSWNTICNTGGSGTVTKLWSLCGHCGWQMANGKWLNIKRSMNTTGSIVIAVQTCESHKLTNRRSTQYFYWPPEVKHNEHTITSNPHSIVSTQPTATF